MTKRLWSPRHDPRHRVLTSERILAYLHSPVRGDSYIDTMRRMLQGVLVAVAVSLAALVVATAAALLGDVYVMIVALVLILVAMGASYLWTVWHMREREVSCEK